MSSDMEAKICVLGAQVCCNDRLKEICELKLIRHRVLAKPHFSTDTSKVVSILPLLPQPLARPSLSRKFSTLIVVQPSAYSCGIQPDRNDSVQYHVFIIVELVLFSSSIVSSMSKASRKWVGGCRK